MIMKFFLYFIFIFCANCICIACDSNTNFKTNNPSMSVCDTNYNLYHSPCIDYHKPTFRWLDIGNSHSLCALKYLRYIAISQGVDLSNIAFCRVSRGGSSFSSWYEGMTNNDDESGDSLTGNKYILTQNFGGLKVHVKGSFFNSSTNQRDYIDKDISRNQISFYGHDTSILYSLLKENDCDLITIHQRSIFHDLYDESNGWKDNLGENYSVSNSGSADKYIHALKELCPQATIGYLFALVPFGYQNYNTQIIYDDKSLEKTQETFYRWCNSINKFTQEYNDIDLVIPCATALENLRISNVAGEDGESILSRFGFNYDNSHTAFGVAAYTMAAVAWEMIFAARFNKSILDNNLLELRDDDIVTSKGRYLQPSYINSDGEKIVIDKNDGAWDKPVIVGYNSKDGGISWTQTDRVKATVRISDENIKTCQKAAILAVKNMWNITNPNIQEIK